MFQAVNRYALALGLIAGCVAASAFAAGTDTAVAYQNNVAHDGTQVDAALAPPYAQAWSVTLPGAVSYPLIADGLVFIVANGASNEPTLFALNQANGATVWSQLLPYPSPFSYPWANAAYDNGKVFAIGSAGVMSAYAALTGTPAWSVQLPLEYLFSSPPAAANGIVYTNGSGSGGEIYAIDENTGAVLAHQVNMNGDHSSPALSNTSVFASFACDQTYGYSLGTLSPIWHYSTGCEGGGGRTAVYANNRVYTRDWAGNGNLVLDAGAGTNLGSYAASTVSPTAPAVLGNTAYYVANNTLTARDVTTPAAPVAKWSFAGDGTLVTAPIVLTTGTKNTVIVGSSTGALYALDAATGAQVWTGAVAAAIAGPDEGGISQPLTGLAAGQGLLVVPAGNTVTAFYGTTPPVMPTRIKQCRNGGWVQYGFASQYACIMYVMTHH
jgi:outer membrane protein assembly factor BamB